MPTCLCCLEKPCWQQRVLKTGERARFLHHKAKDRAKWPRVGESGSKTQVCVILGSFGDQFVLVHGEPMINPSFDAPPGTQEFQCKPPTLEQETRCLLSSLLVSAACTGSKNSSCHGFQTQYPPNTPECTCNPGLRPKGPLINEPRSSTAVMSFFPCDTVKIANLKLLPSKSSFPHPSHGKIS